MILFSSSRGSDNSTTTQDAYTGRGERATDQIPRPLGGAAGLASARGLVSGLVLRIPRTDVEPRNDPAEQAEARPLAPAFGVAGALVHARQF